MNRVVLGSLAGCAATVPMTWTMAALHRQLPEEQRYPLPPRQVTMRAARAAGVEPPADEETRHQATLVAHFGMGTALGTLYGAAAATPALRGPVAGAAVGLGVWAANYLGLLPALGLLRPATEHPPHRTGLMIAAHLVWGAVAGTLLDCCSEE